jgi:hypothetical protein
LSDTSFEEHARPAEVLAGFLAAISLTASLIAVAYRPVRLAPAAIILALIAAGMAGRESRLPAIAVGVGTLCWLAGMTIAVITSRPLY